MGLGLGLGLELGSGIGLGLGLAVGQELLQDERGLGGDGLEAELLGALRRARPEGVARQQRGLGKACEGG